MRYFSACAEPAPARARNRVVLPYDYGKDVFIEFDPHHFLSRTERAQHGEPSTTSVMCHLDLVKDDLLSATALVMGTPSFTHFRNHGAALELSDHAPDWFETWPEDIIELAACADIAPPADSVWRKALAEIPTAFVYQALVEILGGARLARRQGEDGANSLMIAAGVHRKYVEPDPDLEKTGDGATPAAMVVVADTAGREAAPADLRDRPDAMAALSATPAELWIVQHCNTIGADIREMVREFAVRPHAPRRFCLIDGADTWRILKAYGKL